MKERPILFSGPMVRELLAGRKTQTRRPVKPQLPDEPTKEAGCRWGLIDGEFFYCGVRCPYGAPGDRLWVREQHSLLERDMDGGLPPAWYWADGNPERGDWTRPRPSIHMPRWASRLLLEVESVRVERLQAITEEDARAEGFSLADAVKVGVPSARDVLRYRWDEMYGESEFEWDRAPWVWVVTFRRVEVAP